MAKIKFTFKKNRKDMNKQDFIKKYPDVALQEMTTRGIISRAEIEKAVEGLCDALDTGLVSYESRGTRIKVFTSYRMKKKLGELVAGSTVTDPNTGQTGTVVSESPVLMAREMVVRVDFGGDCGWYSCDYFIEEDPA